MCIDLLMQLLEDPTTIYKKKLTSSGLGGLPRRRSFIFNGLIEWVKSSSHTLCG